MTVTMDDVERHLYAFSRKYPAFVRLPKIVGWTWPDPYPAEIQASSAEEDRIDCDQHAWIIQIALERDAQPDMGGVLSPGDMCAVYGCFRDVYSAPVRIPLCRRHYEMTRSPTNARAYAARAIAYTSLRWCPLRAWQELPPPSR